MKTDICLMLFYNIWEVVSLNIKGLLLRGGSWGGGGVRGRDAGLPVNSFVFCVNKERERKKRKEKKL